MCEYVFTHDVNDMYHLHTYLCLQHYVPRQKSCVERLGNSEPLFGGIICIQYILTPLCLQHICIHSDIPGKGNETEASTQQKDEVHETKANNGSRTEAILEDKELDVNESMKATAATEVFKKSFPQVIKAVELSVMMSWKTFTATVKTKH